MSSKARALTRKPSTKTAIKPRGRAMSSTIGRIARLTTLNTNAAAKASRNTCSGAGSTKEMPGKMAAVHPLRDTRQPPIWTAANLIARLPHCQCRNAARYGRILHAGTEYAQPGEEEASGRRQPPGRSDCRLGKRTNYLPVTASICATVASKSGSTRPFSACSSA